MRDFKSDYGPWAVIAGASAGIGAAYARNLAAKGLNLVLVSRRKKVLDGLARWIASRYPVAVRSVPLDLGGKGFPGKLKDATRDLDVGLLICNATFPCTGEFLDHPVKDHLRLIDVNCRAPVVLIHHYSGLMKKRKRSGIILMSSLAAFSGTPWLSHYGASKSYILGLGEGLAYELRAGKIDMLVCCPGATGTENYYASLPKSGASGIPVMKPDSVAGAALKALGRTSVLIPGVLNGLAAFFMNRILGRRAAVSIMAGVGRKLYQKKARG